MARHLLNNRFSVLALLLLFAPVAWAGTDMSSASNRIRRSDVNSGGSNQGSSASFKMTDSVGTIGGKLLSGTTFFVFSGFSNLVSHPDSIEDLAETTGVSPDQLVLSWTAPTAYGSTGTATSYAVRDSTTPINSELDYINAEFYTNGWVPKVPGGLEVQTVSGLTANTTYYFAVKGVDQAGNAGYLSNSASAATLTGAVSGIEIIAVYESSVTLAWTALGVSNAEGYVVQGSTVAGFNGGVHSTSTADGSVTTLTVTGLRRGALNFLRVGGINWSGTPNFVVAPSTITLPGPPPTNPILQAVYASSITLSWGAVASDDGYSAEAFNDSLFTSLAARATTANGNATSLTIQSLIANDTYYLRVGSLYDAATNYAFVTPVSTLTAAAVPINGVITTVTPSTISITWGGSINSAGTVFEADVSSISALGLSSQTIFTAGLGATFVDLTQDTTYWVRVKALGGEGNDSPYLVIGSSVTGVFTHLIIPTNITFTDVELSSVTVGWLPTGSAEFVYDVDLAPADPFGTHQFVTVASSAATFTGLSVDSLYSARVRAHSTITEHVSDYSSTVSTYTLAEPPLNLSTTAVTGTSVSLLWSGNGNPSNALYSIERSTDGVNFMAVGNARDVTYQDQGLVPGTAYAYRVRAMNEDGVPTAYSNTIQVMTTGVATLPKRPSGIWIERADTGGGNFQMTYQWHRVTQRTDGSPLTNLSGYQIYTAPSLLTPMAQWTLITTVGSESWSTTANNNTVNYYAIRAIDSNGVLSDWTQILDDTVDMNHFFVAFDNVTRVQMPMVTAEILRYEHNTFGADLWIDLAEMYADETGRVVRSIKITVYDTLTGAVVPSILFNPPLLRGIIGYNVQNGNVVAGAPEPISSFTSGRIPVISAANASQQLSLFWFNGLEWIKTSGSVNPADNTVDFIGSQVGSYQIRAASHGSGVTLTRVYPRIITPNGDGWNDKAIFQFDNPQLTSITGKIYDISGAFVASLSVGPNPDSTLSWNGKDSSGRPVPGGIYIYQIDLGGSSESGTLVVAR